MLRPCWKKHFADLKLRDGAGRGGRGRRSRPLPARREPGGGVPPLLSLTELVRLPRVCPFLGGVEERRGQCLHRVAKRGGLQSVKRGR